MLFRLFQRLSYANVTATLALFVALGGTAYAVNTVGSSDIIDGQVKSVDIGDGEVNSADVKDQSLTTFDVSTFLGADVVDGTLTGADIQDDSVQFNDIGREAIGSDEVTNDSLLQSDIRAGAVTSDEVLNSTLISADVQDGSLNDEDISQTRAIDFTANIGVMSPGTCDYREVTGLPNIGGDHLLLTPGPDASQFLVFGAEYNAVGSDSMSIKVCNFNSIQIDDGNTHFNLLVIDAQ